MFDRTAQRATPHTVAINGHSCAPAHPFANSSPDSHNIPMEVPKERPRHDAPINHDARSIQPAEDARQQAGIGHHR